VETEIPSLEDLLKKMETTREKAKTAMEKTKETMKRQYNKRTRQSQGIKTGEQVWLETRNIQTNKLSKKLLSASMCLRCSKLIFSLLFL